MRKYFSIGVNELDTYLDYSLLGIISLYIVHATPQELGILGACFAFPFLFSSQIFGKLFDEKDILKYRRLLFFVNVMITPLLLIMNNVYALYLVATFKTLARCGINISNTKLNSDDNETSRFYEIYGYLINVSRIIIPIVVVIINNLFSIWGVIFLSVLLNLVGVFTSLGIYISENTINNKEDSYRKEKYSFVDLLRSDKELFCLVAGYTLSNLAFFLSNDLLGLFFKTIGQHESSIGYIISLLGIGGFIGTKFASLINNKLPSAAILIISMSINTAIFFIFGFIDSSTASLYYACIIFIGSVSGINFFAIRYGVRNIVGYMHAGKATGTIQMLSSIVAIIMPIAGGWIANNYTIYYTFKATSILLFITILMLVYPIIQIRKGENTYEKPT
jgi:hypothetical protein